MPSVRRCGGSPGEWTGKLQPSCSLSLSLFRSVQHSPLSKYCVAERTRLRHRAFLIPIVVCSMSCRQFVVRCTRQLSRPALPFSSEPLSYLSYPIHTFSSRGSVSVDRVPVQLMQTCPSLKHLSPRIFYCFVFLASLFFSYLAILVRNNSATTHLRRWLYLPLENTKYLFISFVNVSSFSSKTFKICKLKRHGPWLELLSQSSACWGALHIQPALQPSMAR